MKKATPNRFLTAGRPGVFKVKMSLGRAMKTTDLNGGLNGGFGTLGPASSPPDQSIHTQRAYDELLPHPHTNTRNAKQERRSTGEHTKKDV